MRKSEESENPNYSISNDESSPQKLLFERLSNKWFLMLLSALHAEPKRFNQLLREHARLSQKMLSQTLKNLEEDGLVAREVNGNRMPVQVTYKITPFGINLIDIVSPLFKWSNENVGKVLENRRKYIKKYSSGE
ncbi:hypothetical protein DT73_26165 [Mangrovibacter sp. MFB070]|uniref:winged helix-turn-helix transcriptional regulator n=1 Tax=Mangrovibacter sp. MFB070 TaxID=1224318 RepID=UPI0004D5B256|nr:helix-turn-helix domain-containing protein [Mangrovibacter sp. MFB070]KEA49925.1 hypothetical protein DT73_26165 [Mangrovibacter sp. MFB070]